MFRFFKSRKETGKHKPISLPADKVFPIAATVHQFTQYTLDEFGRVGLIGVTGDQELVALEAYEWGALRAMIEEARDPTQEFSSKEAGEILFAYANIVCQSEFVHLLYAKFGLSIDPNQKFARLDAAAKVDPEASSLGLRQARRLIAHAKGDPSEPDYDALRRLLAQRHKDKL